MENRFQRCHKNGEFQYKLNIVERLTNLIVAKYPGMQTLVKNENNCENEST